MQGLAGFLKGVVRLVVLAAVAAAVLLVFDALFVGDAERPDG
jgi:hypothetical protein